LKNNFKNADENDRGKSDKRRKVYKIIPLAHQD
jgi:hypothetical protein